MTTRKVVKVYIAREFILQLLTQGTEYPKTTTIEGLPEGAIYVTNRHDPWRDEVYFIFTHESFKLISEGGEIPELKIRWQHD